MIRFLTALFLGMTGLAGATDKYPKNPDIDVQHYRFELEVSDNTDEIKCIATIDILLRKKAIASIRLDLVSVTAGKGMVIENVLQSLPGGESIRPQWLRQPGHPRLNGSWHYNAKEKTVEVEIAQRQNAATFDFSVEVGIYSKAGTSRKIKSIVPGTAAARLSFPVESRPDSVVLDPRTVLLAEWQFVKK